MKVLIIGNDIHAKRYKDVLFFRNDLELYYNEYENINLYDVIIFSVPFMFDYEWFLKLKYYKNIIIFEKCQFEIELINKLIAKKYIVHLRDFDTNKFKFKKENQIIWPNLINDGMNEIKHTIPNVLDLIRNNTSNFDINVISINKEEKSYHIKLENDNKLFCIIINNKEKFGDKVILNKKELNWPDYFKCINIMFDKILSNELDDSLDIENKYKTIIKEMEEKI